MNNQAFSIMKGIAIISVVLGHCTTNSRIEAFVNQYHLAVFFFVAGFFFKEKYVVTPMDFIWKKVKRFYVPFVVAGIGCLLLHNIFYHLNIYDTELTIAQFGKGIFDVTIRMVSNELLMGAMWFCPAMLIVSIIGLVGFKIASLSTWNMPLINKRAIVFVLIVIMGSVCIRSHLKSPYCIWQYMIVSGVFFEGYLFSKLVPKLSMWNKNVVIFILLFVLMLILTQYGIYGRLQPDNIKNESPVSILFIGMIGSTMVYSLAKLVEKVKIGKWIAICGEYSFSIMLLHFLGFKLVNWFQCWFYGYPLEKIADFPFISFDVDVWMVFYVLLGTTIPIALSKVFGLVISKAGKFRV